MVTVVSLSPEQLQSMLDKAAKQAVDLTIAELKAIEPDREMTRREIKEEYSVSYPTIHAYMNSGALSFLRKGGRVFFMKSEVEKVFKKPVTAKKILKIKKS